MCSYPIVCVLLPRFELAVAAGGREALLQARPRWRPSPAASSSSARCRRPRRPSACSPGCGWGRRSRAARRWRSCRPIRSAVADAWEEVLGRAGVRRRRGRARRPGLACFDARGLLRLHGGTLDGVLAAARAALRRPARIGAGPSRFCALAGALARAARGAPRSLPARASWRASRSALLRHARRPRTCPTPLERLGIAHARRPGGAAARGVADRFGPPGLRAHDLARGRDTPLRPRAPASALEEALSCRSRRPGAQLERALALLIDRLLARRDRRGRTIRAAVVSARLVEGGTWRERVVFREATGDAARMRLALTGRLAMLPAPAEALRLAVDRFGPPPAASGALFERRRAAARARGCARRSARPARPRARTPRCACWRSTRLARARAPRGADAVEWRSSGCWAPSAEAPPAPAPRSRRAGRRPAVTVDGREVEAVRESWLVEDRWWTDAPLRRRYWEVLVARRSQHRRLSRPAWTGGWFEQASA